MIAAMTIEQVIEEITVQQYADLTVQQLFPQITFIGTLTMNSFLPFSFSAVQGNLSQGQTVFNLPSPPLAIWLYISGTAQNQANGDFTVNGTTLTLSGPINSFDTVYGVIQIT